MNQRLIKSIIVFITIALIGLVGIQVHWIHQDMHVKEKQFNQAVYMALQRSAFEIEKKNAFGVFESGLPVDAATLFDGPIDQILEAFNNVSNRHLSSELSGELNIKLNYEYPDNSGQSVENTIQFEGEEDGSLNITLDTLVTAQQASGQSPAKVKYYEHLFEDLARDWAQQGQSLLHKVSPQELETTLARNLKLYGINATHQYALAEDEPGQPVILTNSAEEILNDNPNNYFMPIFAGDIFGNSGILMVNFPSKKKYLLKSMYPLLIASALFILIISLCFAASIQIIFKQKKLSNLKTDFINNMTHEFKTPVATIGLATEMLQNDAILNHPDKIKSYSTIIKDENKRMNTHIEKVLQAAKLENDEFKLSKTYLDIHDVLNSISNSFQIRLQSEGGTVSQDLKAKPSFIHADEVHITNVFSNIMDNAIKYRGEDPPKVNITTKNSKKGISIFIKDNGIGMSKEAAKRIFEQFYRVPTGNIHNVKGFGLGLSYVKTVIDAHDGTIQVKSDIRKGSVFEIFLPN